MIKGAVENVHMFTWGYPHFRRLQVEMLTSQVNILRLSTGPFQVKSDQISKLKMIKFRSYEIYLWKQQLKLTSKWWHVRKQLRTLNIWPLMIISSRDFLHMKCNKRSLHKVQFCRFQMSLLILLCSYATKAVFDTYALMTRMSERFSLWVHLHWNVPNSRHISLDFYRYIVLFKVHYNYWI